MGQDSSGSASIEVPPHDPWIGTLSNGLDVLIKPVPEAPVASVQVWCRTGSTHEGEHLGAGLSHLLEHMLFNGTERRASGQVSRDVQAAGAYINAYTSFDRTVYWIETPPEGLETSIDVLADMTLNSTLPDNEFQKELDVIRREMAMGEDQPSQVCSKLMFRTVFRSHPCRFPVIGHREIFDSITHEELNCFYRHHYVPNNMFVVVCGPVEIDATLERIEKHFGGARRAAMFPPVIPREPAQQGKRIRHIETNAQLTSLRMAWQAPPLTHPDTVALDVLSTVLGTGRSSRLYQEIRQNQQLAHSVSAFLYAMPDTGLFGLAGELDPDKRPQAEEAMMRVLLDTLNDGVTEDEVRKSVHMAVAEALGQLTTTRGQANDIGSSWHLTGTAEFTSHYLNQIQKVDAAAVQAAARQHLDLENVNIISVNPRGSLLARKAGASVVIDHLAHRMELENGLTLLVKPESRLPLVTIHTAFRGGLLGESAETAGITRLISRLLTRDTANRSSGKIAERIESVGGDFSNFSGNNSFGLSAEMMRPDWKMGLETVAEALTGAAFLETALEREREAQLAAIKSELDRPINVAARMLREAMYSHHPYRFPVSGTDGSIRSISRDDLLAHRDRHLLARNCVITIYGDVQIDEAREATEGLLKGLPQGDRLFRDTPLAPAAPTRIRLEKSHDKEQSILLAGFPTGNIYDEDALVLELIDDACSDMSSRFYTRIREEMGAAYMVSCNRTLGFAGGCFFFYVATSPHQLDEVEKALLEEIDHLANHGLEEDAFKRARQSWHGSHLNRLQSLAGRARIHALDELFDFGWDRSMALPSMMDAITPEQVRDVAGRHFSADRGVVVRLGIP